MAPTAWPATARSIGRKTSGATPKEKRAMIPSQPAIATTARLRRILIAGGASAKRRRVSSWRGPPPAVQCRAMLARLALLGLLLIPLQASAETPAAEARTLLTRYHEDLTAIDRARNLLEAAVVRESEVDTTIMLSYVSFLWGDVRATTTEEKLAAYARGRELGRRAVELAPRNHDAHLWYAINTGRWGQTKGVLRSLFLLPTVREEIQILLQLNPRSVRAHSLAGNVAMEVPGLFGAAVDPDRSRAHRRSDPRPFPRPHRVHSVAAPPGHDDGPGLRAALRRRRHARRHAGPLAPPDRDPHLSGRLLPDESPGHPGNLPRPPRALRGARARRDRRAPQAEGCRAEDRQPGRDDGLRQAGDLRRHPRAPDLQPPRIRADADARGDRDGAPGQAPEAILDRLQRPPRRLRPERLHADLAPVLHVCRAGALPAGRRQELALAASAQGSEEGEVTSIGNGLGLLRGLEHLRDLSEPSVPQ